MWKTVTVTTKTELLGERKTAVPETFDELMEEFVELREQALRDVRDVVIDSRIRGRSLEHLQQQIQNMTERFEALSAHAARLHEAHVPVPDQYGLVHEGPRTYEWSPPNAAGIRSAPLHPSDIPYRASPFGKLREVFERRRFRRLWRYSAMLLGLPTTGAAILGMRFLLPMLALQLLALLPVFIEARFADREASRWRERALTAERFQE